MKFTHSLSRIVAKWTGPVFVSVLGFDDCIYVQANKKHLVTSLKMVEKRGSSDQYQLTIVCGNLYLDKNDNR